MTIQAEYRDNPYSSTTAFGRVFYGFDNLVMFSQVLIDDINVLGKCYQKNDPTSPDISDLLATDGGEINLQNAGRVYRIVEFLNGVIAFCDKGVFYIYGPQAGFSAVEYSVQKVTEFSLYSNLGFCRVGDSLFYVSLSGIFALQPNEFGELKAVNITESTINTFYESFVARDISSEFNLVTKQIFFVSKTTKKGLVYDTRAQAWYPQQFSGTDIEISGMVRKRNRLLFVNNNTDTNNHNFATMTSRTFTDFGVNYTSYLLSQPESLGEFTRKQTVVNMRFLFKKTETNITGYSAGKYVYDFPSSCTFKAYWDFDNTNAFKKVTSEVQLYKPEQRGFIPTSFPFAFDTGESVIEKRINVRGTGKAVQFEFSSEAGKDMQLLGYGVEWSQGSRQ